jgi:hypothetical protein
MASNDTKALPPRQECRCLSDRMRVFNRALDAFICPDCGGYRSR